MAALIFVGILILTIGVVVSIVLRDEKGPTRIIAPVVTLILTVGYIIFCYWYMNNTQEGRRTIRDINNNFINSIEREVIVYDINGKVIQTFKGSFDIEYKDDRIMFDDDDGRHIIYFKTGTIIVNDIESNKEE